MVGQRTVNSSASATLGSIPRSAMFDEVEISQCEVIIGGNNFMPA